MNTLAITLTDDKQIIEGFKSGRTETAALAFVKKYQKFVYSTAYRYLNNYDDAEDISQEVFIKAIDKIKDFRGDSSIKTWLYKITVNFSLSFIRKRKLKNILSFNQSSDRENYRNESKDESNTADKQLIYRELNETFASAVNALPDKQRETFALRYFENLTYEEISSLLKTSVGGLKANYFQAVKKISQKLKDEGYHE